MSAQQKVAAFSVAQEQVVRAASALTRRAARCEVCQQTSTHDGRLSLHTDDMQIDMSLCPDHLLRLSRRLADWLQASDEQTVRPDPAKPSARRLRQDESADAIRAWARDNGMSTARQGSLSDVVVTAYRQAHGTARTGDAGAAGTG